jgi:hypothetical protein
VNARFGRVTDVLYVNDEAGDARRTVRLMTYQPMTVHVGAPPASRERSDFALFARRGAEPPIGPMALPFGLGDAAIPMPLAGDSRGTVTVASTFAPPRRRRLGDPLVRAEPAPFTVITLRAGLGRRAEFTLQALIEDPGSLGPGVSVSNAVFVRVE